jgi:DNA-binding CsgD family transcriptional regulator
VANPRYGCYEAMDTHSDQQVALLVSAREAHLRRDWAASYEDFARVHGVGPLDVSDLDALAQAAWRIGKCKESIRLAEQVFNQLARSDPAAAAAKAVDVALAWLTRGDLNIGQGWMNRARRLLADSPESLAHAYLAYLDAYLADLVGDVDALRRQAAVLAELSHRLDAPVVTALGLVVQALAAISDVRMPDAFRLIDEAMLPVLADELPVEWAGDIYCLILHHCHRLADVQRMRAWTQSMRQWCDEIAASPTYGNLCDVYRLQLQAATDDCRTLEAKLSLAGSSLEEINAFAAAAAYYQLGECRRMRGDVESALAAFARARELGCDPQPGQALAHYRRGDGDSAWTELQMALGWQDRIGRTRLLRAAVEVSLGRDCLAEAEHLSDELCSAAEDFGTSGFLAWAAHARGAVLSRRGDHEGALVQFHFALRVYRDQQCRYEMAQVYELMAVVRAALGDDVLAAGDAAVADGIRRQLGLDPGIEPDRRKPGGLTEREVDILIRLASGATNKQVAEQVFLSEKTIRRHLSNIFAKLGVSSRTAAVSWAYANGVLDPAVPSHD